MAYGCQFYQTGEDIEGVEERFMARCLALPIFHRYRNLSYLEAVLRCLEQYLGVNAHPHLRRDDRLYRAPAVSPETGLGVADSIQRHDVEQLVHRSPVLRYSVFIR